MRLGWFPVSKRQLYPRCLLTLKLRLRFLVIVTVKCQHMWMAFYSPKFESALCIHQQSKQEADFFLNHTVHLPSLILFMISCCMHSFSQMTSSYCSTIYNKRSSSSTFSCWQSSSSCFVVCIYGTCPGTQSLVCSIDRSLSMSVEHIHLRTCGSHELAWSLWLLLVY